MTDDDDDDYPELTDLVPLSFVPSHEDLRARRSRCTDPAFLDLLLFDDDMEDE